MDQFYNQDRAVKPYVIVKDRTPEVELVQTPEQRENLDGLDESVVMCLMLNIMSSLGWNPDKFMGLAALLQASFFIEDSRDPGL